MRVEFALIYAGVAPSSRTNQGTVCSQMLNFELIGGVISKSGLLSWSKKIVARSQYLSKLKRRGDRFRVEGVNQIASSGWSCF